MPRIQLAALALLGIACGSSMDETGPLDDFPEVPTKESAVTVEYEFQEQTIQPGGDIQTCQFLDEVPEDMYIRSFRSFQGKHGHHLILFSAVIHEAPGTVRDCSDAEDMVRFRPVMSNERFGYEQFPEGMAVKVRAGTQLVLQQHYVNTTDRPLRTRDVAHLTPVPASEVTTLVGFLGLSDITFEFPPSEELQTMVFDRRIPFNTNILVIGPHMHEWGVSFKTEIGPENGPMNAMIDIPVWSAEYRDAPPLLAYDRTTAPPLNNGDVIRTTCVFKNTTKKTLEFPEEMCATFGYYFPAPEGGEEIICAGDES